MKVDPLGTKASKLDTSETLRTNATLLFPPEGNIIVQDVILIDPDLEIKWTQISSTPDLFELEWLQAMTRAPVLVAAIYSDNSRLGITCR